MIEENVKNLLESMPEHNPQGEKITLVAAIKTQTVENINRAIRAGIRDIGDNHAQEFRDKNDSILPEARRHFIGHLQTNKLKYLIGKVGLYQSIDRLEIAKALSEKSQKAGVTSEILLQLNIGNEESKSGFDPDDAERAYLEVSSLKNLKITGLMAMLPESDDEALLRSLATRMRETYDNLNAKYGGFVHLSMGMSGDWKLCVECGSKMIRLGTAIFGPRHYD